MEKSVVDLCKAHNKEFNKNYKPDNSDLFKICNVSFSTSDCQMTTRDGVVSVTAKIGVEDFQKIIEMNIANVMSFLENKGFNITKK